MSPPAKRALFSLNLASDADLGYERIAEPTKDGREKVKIVETQGPTHTHSDLSYVTKPFGNLVNRAVDDVLEESGKQIGSKEGDITYRSERREQVSGNVKTRGHDSDGRGKGPLNVVSKIKRRNIERKYDVSEL